MVPPVSEATPQAVPPTHPLPPRPPHPINHPCVTSASLPRPPWQHAYLVLSRKFSSVFFWAGTVNEVLGNFTRVPLAEISSVRQRLDSKVRGRAQGLGLSLCPQRLGPLCVEHFHTHTHTHTLYNHASEWEEVRHCHGRCHHQVPGKLAGSLG